LRDISNGVLTIPQTQQLQTNHHSMDYILLLIGLALLLVAANYLVDSSVAIAQRAKISNFIIGLTIVGIGTSAPELFVSVSSALKGSGDIAMGNVLGSNIANVLLIMGVTALILPFPIERLQRRRDIPFVILASLFVMLIANDTIVPGIQANSLSRLDGIVLLVCFIAYMCWVVVQKGKDPKKALEEADEEASSSWRERIPGCCGALPSFRWWRSFGAATCSWTVPRTWRAPGA